MSTRVTIGGNSQVGAMLAGTATTIVLAIVAAWAVADWIQSSRSQSIITRTPFMDGTDAMQASAAPQKVDIEGLLTRFGSAPTEMPTGPPTSAWPGFRGPHLDNIAHDCPPLLDRFPEAGPPVVWRLALGEGYAGAAVRNGRVYVLDHDEQGKADVLRCFDLSDGHEIWRRAYGVHVKRNHGMSRTTPAVTQDAVVSLGPKCHVLCVDARDGEYRWGIDLVAEYGTTVPLWYAGQCPLIDGRIAVLAPAGAQALMIGVDTKTGATEWRTPNPNGWKMSHASVMPMTLAGRRMYVYPAIGGMVGVAADGEERGTILWETREWTGSILAPSVIPIGTNHILATAGYGSGSAVFEIRDDSAGYTITPLRTLKKTEFACEQHTPIFYNDHLYTILPSDGGRMRRQLICADANGELVWASGKTDRFGLGPFMIADGKLWVLDDEGVLSLIDASTRGYSLLGRAQVLEGVESWAPMALTGTRLILRDSKVMICLDVGAERGAI